MATRTGQTILQAVYSGSLGDSADGTLSPEQPDSGTVKGLLAEHARIRDLEVSVKECIYRIRSLEMENAGLKDHLTIASNNRLGARKLIKESAVSSIDNRVSKGSPLLLELADCSHSDDEQQDEDRLEVITDDVQSDDDDDDHMSVSTSASRSTTSRRLTSARSFKSTSSSTYSTPFDSPTPRSRTSDTQSVLCANKYMLFALVITSLLQHVQSSIEHKHSCSYAQSVSRGLGRLSEVIRVVCSSKGQELPPLKDKGVSYLNRCFSRSDKTQVPHLTTSSIDTIFRVPMMDDFVRHMRTVIRLIRPYSSFLIHPSGYILDRLRDEIFNPEGGLAIDYSSLVVTTASATCSTRYKMKQKDAIEALKNKIAESKSDTKTKRSSKKQSSHQVQHIPIIV